MSQEYPKQSPYAFDRATVERVFARWLDQPVWVTWLSVPNDHGKPNKLPTPKINAPTLLTFEEVASRAAGGICGIGIVLGRKATRGLGGIDPDNSRNRDTGEISEPVRSLLEEWDTYAEVSPSGTGIKLYALGAPKSLPFTILHGDDLVFECYTENRFFAVTGWQVEGAPDAINLCETQWRGLVPKLRKRKAAADKEAAGRDDWVFKLACSMRARNTPQDAIWAALVTANAQADDKAHPNFASDGPLDEKTLRAKFKQAMKYEAGPSNDDERPAIRVRAGQWHEAATQAEAALMEAKAPIYTWAGRLVRPIREAAGAVQLRRLSQANVLDWLSRHIVWQQKRGDEIVCINPPKDVAAILLERAGDWSFSAISGVINCPTMRPDGSLLTQAGYDPQTRLYLVDPPKLPAMPEAPTREDAEAALGLLDDLLVEFPIIGEPCRSVALSLLMTPVLRGAMDVAPMHVVRATTARTGKTLLTNLAALIATGRTAPVLSLACRTEEQEKRLGGALLSGQPVISIDNHNGELSGDLLAQAIEQALVLVRPLGTSDTVRVENRFCFLANGNGITLRDDLVGRSLLVHLDAECETPQLREFAGNPAETIREDRGRYVAAALTVARAYIVAECPGQLPPPASFADWSQLVRSALVWLGRADPLITQEQLQDEEPVRDVLRDVIQAWAQARARRPGLFQRPMLVRELLAHAMDEELQLLTMVLRDATRQRGDADDLNAVKVGQWLKRHEGRIVDGCRLMSKMDRTKQKAWWLDGEPPAPEEPFSKAEQPGVGNVVRMPGHARATAPGMPRPSY